VRIVFDWLARLVRSRAMRPVLDALRETFRGHYVRDVVRSFREKTAPLNLAASAGEPVRVNLLIPEIDFAHLFGGYLAKLHLADRLVRRGRRVRLVMVDRCEPDLPAWREAIRAWPGLDGLFERVEVAACHDRSRPLAVNPADAWVATTWWTAHIAHRAAGAEFFYLIQEYEPFTLPMGAYHALAERSYELPHQALFSSELLMQYFQRQGVGCFSGADWARPERAAFFENAILSFTPDPEVMRGHSPRRLLFYARPEPHASRNMFELAYSALWEAVERGVFPVRDWEFHGVGSDYGDLPLPHGAQLRMLGKLDLDGYRACLPGYDVGLSLMYTPHPSLVPLDMAAAGLVVVTNTCMNKTAASLAALSSNLVAGAPDLDGIVSALGQAAERSADAGGRVAGSRVHWAQSWDACFNDRLLERIEAWIDGRGESTKAGE